VPHKIFTRGQSYWERNFRNDFRVLRNTWVIFDCFRTLSSSKHKNHLELISLK
jgi:hypothetical protein